MNGPWLGSASPMVIPSVVPREQFLLAGSDPSTRGFRQNPEDRAKANAFWRASNPLLLDAIPRRWQRSDPRGVGNKPRARIQVPLDRSDGEVLVRLPRVFGQDAGPVRTDINGVGEFVGGILEAVEFHKHLHGGADFRATCGGPGRHRAVFSKWSTRCCQSGWLVEQ